MRILMVGDVVGRPGRKAIKENVPDLVRSQQIDLTVVNGENAAGGKGITREIAREILAAGADIITMGNHVWQQKEALTLLAREERIVRPANYPPGVPGHGLQVLKTRSGVPVAVLNLAGRVFMEALDCPFRKADELLAALAPEVRVILLDFHAEASSEKIAMGWYLDGRVSAVCGTHTHVQTADEHILPGGTAYITDVGMTGPVDSIIGVEKEAVLEKFLTGIPRRFEVATGPYQLNAVILDIDENTGRARSIQRVQNFE
ncbi:MAG: TIGR00282 family metallophosphoesterase [Desulfurispora sp.]|uniref:TIGR00282 family metallophosphoesterase n=1 Tax=Desulfurispora sp. TaxID=3014275 RepID=UPI00404B7FCC